MDLAEMFGQQQAPALTAAEQAEHDHFARRSTAVQREQIARVAKFASILCGCPRRYNRDDAAAPQSQCAIHGHLMMDENGPVIM